MLRRTTRCGTLHNSNSVRKASFTTTSACFGEENPRVVSRPSDGHGPHDRPHDRWALDGRDPNSYTGIGWVMGKFDRGWTERAVYGKVRCMTSASTARKFKPKATLKIHGSHGLLKGAWLWAIVLFRSSMRPFHANVHSRRNL